MPETPRKTKRKSAKVKTVKVKTVKVKTVFGFMQGEGKMVGDIVSPLFLEDNWDAER